jgi:hypothetical protein
LLKVRIVCILSIYRFIVEFTAGPEPKNQKLNLVNADTLMKSDQSNNPLNSESLPYNELPEEVLEQIFKFLDREMLLKSLLINSRWKRTIEKSSKLTQKLPLTIDLDDDWQHYELSKSQRFYQEIKINGIKTQITKRLIKVMKMIGSTVKTVKYNTGNGDFSGLLGCFPNVENISVDNFEFLGFDYVAPQLSKLKTLKLNNIDFFDEALPHDFFSMFPTIQHLHLSELNTCLFGIVDENMKTVQSNLKHVETLTITGSSESYESEDDINSISRTFSGFFRFVENEVFENLRALTMTFFDASLNFFWHKFIVNNLKLQHIEIEIEFNQRYLDFEELVTHVRNGMKLIIRGKFELTEERLRSYKENSSRRVRLQILKYSLMMTEEVFEEIMGEDKQLIELIYL